MQSPERSVPTEPVDPSTLKEVVVVGDKRRVVLPTEKRFECPQCEQKKPGALMSSTSDLCTKCEENNRWAEQRAAGKAAFVRHDSARGAYSRGTAVAYCCTCAQIVVGSKAIKRHFDHCRRK